MAANLADAWKSHILQDFQFPQEFPQRDMGAETSVLQTEPALFPRNKASRASNS
jgi:hypothetical protein